MRIIISFVFIFSLNIYAQCINKKFVLDTDCNCARKNNCLKFRTAQYKKQVGSTAKYMGQKNAVTIYKMNINSMNTLDRLLKGDKQISDENIKVIDKKNKKLRALNKKIKPLVEKRFKELGFKEYQLDKRAANINNFYDRIFKKHNLERVNFVALDAFKKKVIKSNKKEIAKIDVEEVISKEMIKNKDLIIRKYQVDKKRLNAAYKKNYKVPLISKSVNIFSIISLRYKQKYSILVGDKLFFDIKIDKKSLHKDFRELLDKYFKN